MSDEAVKEAAKAVKEVAKTIDTTVVQDKVMSIFDALQNGAVELGHQVVKYTPDVVNAGLWVIRIDGIQELLTGIVSFIIAVIGTKLLKKLWKYSWEGNGGPTVHGVAAFLVAIATGFSYFIASSTLINIWNWIRVFEPKLYLAKLIITSALK